MLKTKIKKIIKKPLGMFLKIKNYLEYKKTFKKFKKLSEEKGNRFPVERKNVYFITGEATQNTGFDAHYIYHPSWAARILAKTRPEFHVDISSKLYFSTIVSAFIPVKFYDYRPASINLSNLTCGKADLLSLPFKDNSIKSISCMHTIEHVGLGRYGDPLDPNGDIKAINELKRVISKNGDVLFVVPIGKPKLMFNAHRIYSYSQIIEYFKDFELKDFSLIPDDATKTGIINNAIKEQADKQEYGCGCFWFKK